MFVSVPASMSPAHVRTHLYVCAFRKAAAQSAPELDIFTQRQADVRGDIDVADINVHPCVSPSIAYIYITVT